jgi:hypothetical protein
MAWDGTWTAIGSYSIGGIGAVVEEIADVLPGVVTTDDGIWFDNSGCIGMNVEVSGITTGTVVVVGHNGTFIPANTSHHEVLESITADGIKSYDAHQLSRYNKIYCSVGTTVNLNVRVKRIRRSG